MCIIITAEPKLRLFDDTAACGGVSLQGVLTVRLIDTMGVRLGLLFCKLTLTNLAIMFAPVKESDSCLMLFTEGF